MVSFLKLFMKKLDMNPNHLSFFFSFFLRKIPIMLNTKTMYITKIPKNIKRVYHKAIFFFSFLREEIFIDNYSTLIKQKNNLWLVRKLLLFKRPLWNLETTFTRESQLQKSAFRGCQTREQMHRKITY